MRIPLEEVDLAELTASVQARFAGAAPVGYLDGRTAVRDVVVSELDCSTLEAEEIVDTLVAQGFLRYEGDPIAALDDERSWSFRV